MIVESWLNEQTEKSVRGRVFGIYTMVNLGATTLGQLSLTLGDASGFLFFVVPAIVYAMALLPTALSATQTPAALTRVSLDIRALWRNSPVAVFAVLMVGVSNAAFGTLAAVYAARIGLDLTDIALFASIPVLAGALAQVPIGILSDRYDRRIILIAIASVGLIADCVFAFAGFTSPVANLVLAGFFGASVFTMYPVIVAHANDHAAPGTFIQVSGGLLLVFGIGSIIGPTAAGFAMTEVGSHSLFYVTGGAHVLIILFALLRLRSRAPVAFEDKTAFKVAPMARSITPSTAALAEDTADAAGPAVEETTPSPEGEPPDDPPARRE
jgi:MFS family permease